MFHHTTILDNVLPPLLFQKLQHAFCATLTIMGQGMAVAMVWKGVIVTGQQQELMVHQQLQR
jgi:hypothetical protein